MKFVLLSAVVCILFSSHRVKCKLQSSASMYVCVFQLFGPIQVKALKGPSDWLVVLLSMKVVWSSTIMVSGEQFVMISSIALMVLLSADSWNME